MVPNSIKSDSRRIMDDYVTLRLFLTFSGIGVSVMASVLGVALGYMWAEIKANSQDLKRVPTMIESAISENSSFHVEQRVRLWNRVNEEEAARQRTEKDVAEMSGRVEALIRELDRVIKRLDDVNDRRRGD